MVANPIPPRRACVRRASSSSARHTAIRVIRFGAELAIQPLTKVTRASPGNLTSARDPRIMQFASWRSKLNAAGFESHLPLRIFNNLLAHVLNPAVVRHNLEKK
jgi:hypothetical protein